MGGSGYDGETTIYTEDFNDSVNVDDEDNLTYRRDDYDESDSEDNGYYNEDDNDDDNDDSRSNISNPLQEY